eukprot:CAMPEP_0113942824 /NCGR_PEP_ID=MMETSP1339-20121228/10244_1 /TAXON_ID=94617 /ORGANISM="Fibrocapsa japonica" /LENGTH=135 /DNA_ID=CAMNT_0000947457 /DNA_START=48 /DNA_END=455 /DNA_ORIENTATION=+ /assembly_acc=CAM_ASM_000762
MISFVAKIVIFVLAVSSATAFLTTGNSQPASFRKHVTEIPKANDLQMTMQPGFKKSVNFATSFLTATVPLAALAEEEYVYGAVDAPGWLLPAGAVLSILTAAAIPLFLQGGQEAFDEAKDRDSGKWADGRFKDDE